MALGKTKKTTPTSTTKKNGWTQEKKKLSPENAKNHLSWRVVSITINDIGTEEWRKKEFTLKWCDTRIKSLTERKEYHNGWIHVNIW